MASVNTSLSGEKKKLLALYGLAALLFTPLFVLRGVGSFDFWWWMSFNQVLLISVFLIEDKGYLNILKDDFTHKILFKIFMGLFSALLLFFVFKAGNVLSRFILEFAGKDISSIYSFKGEASSLRIVLLMLFVIGPGEEIVWRGYFQRRIAGIYGPLPAMIIAALIYGAVHIASMNFMLIGAALTCGFFWAFLYMRYQSMLLNCISHTVWDIAVFIIFPFS